MLEGETNIKVCHGVGNAEEILASISERVGFCCHQQGNRYSFVEVTNEPRHKNQCKFKRMFMGCFIFLRSVAF